jgi:polysaccharide export outer membrane protein
VGEADVLRIDVWKEPEVSRRGIAVRPDGMISLPLVGVIKVSGLTPSEIQEMLVAKLSRYLTKPQVTVTVEEIRSKPVYVTGEVVKPGVYQLVAPLDVLQLIVRAGGLTHYAHRRSLFILRTVGGKQEKLLVNYNRLLRTTNTSEIISLIPGDTLVVP